MMKHLFPLIVSLTLCVDLEAQFVITTAPTSPLGITSRFVDLDGGDRITTAYTISSNPELMIQRYTPEGVVQWSRALTPPSGSLWYWSSIASDGNGGLWCALAQNPTLDQSTGITSCAINFSHVNGDGGLEEQWTFHRNWATPDTHTSPRMDHLDLIVQPDGTLLLAASGSSKGFIPMMDIYRFQLDGTLLWARNFGDTEGLAVEGLPYTYTGLHYIFGTPIAPKALSDGSILLGSGGANELLLLQRISSDGDVLWTKSLRYTNSVFYSNFTSLAVDEQDRIHTVGRLDLPTGSFLILTVHDANGVHVRTDLCTLEQPTHYTAGTSLLVAPDGARTLLSSGSSAGAITTIEGLGASVAQHELTAAVEHENLNIGLKWNLHAIHDGNLVLGGYESRQHNVLAYTTVAPALALAPIAGPPNCFSTNTTTAMVEVPPSILQLGEREYFSADIASWMTGPSSMHVWAIAEGPEPTIGQACDLSTGTSITAAAPSSAWLVNNVVYRGEAIRLAEPTTGNVEVYTATGALLSRSRINGTNMIATDGWCAGAYLVKLSATNSTEVRSARVLVVGN